MNIFATDIRDKKEFKTEGHVLRLVEDYGNNLYLYHRTGTSCDGNELDLGYELVIAVRHKNPDGSIIYRYPKSSEWGIYGFTFRDRNGKPFQRKLAELRKKV